jgi:hypothetical protein
MALMRKEQSRPDDTSDYNEDAENFDAYTNQMDQVAYGWFEGIFHPGAHLLVQCPRSGRYGMCTSISK